MKIYLKKKYKDIVWGCSSVVERHYGLMKEVGSIPVISYYFIFIKIIIYYFDDLCTIIFLQSELYNDLRIVHSLSLIEYNEHCISKFFKDLQ